jgi:hypothetical protein
MSGLPGMITLAAAAAAAPSVLVALVMLYAVTLSGGQP